MAKQVFELEQKVVREVKVGKLPKKEEVYTYVNKANGAKLTFHAHPTKAWNWLMVNAESNDEGRKVAGKIVDAFVEAAMSDDKRDFDEKIKTLEIK